MAAGLPVVVDAHRRPPGPRRGRGLLVAVGDPAAVAAEVDRLLADPAERRPARVRRLGRGAAIVGDSRGRGAPVGGTLRRDPLGMT